MENWVLALICTALLISGALIGALSVFLYSRYRRRRLHKKQSQGDVIYEEYETQLTAAEKQVLHRISSADGALSLTLKLPDTTLHIPLSPTPESVCSSSSSGSSTKSLLTAPNALPTPVVSPPGADSELQSAAVPDSENSAERSLSIENGADLVGGNRPNTPQVNDDQKTANKNNSSSSSDSRQTLRPQSSLPENRQMRGLGLGLGLPPSSSSAEQTRTMSVPAAIKPHSKKPAGMSISAVSWSSPVDDKNARIATPANDNSSDSDSVNGDDDDDDDDLELITEDDIDQDIEKCLEESDTDDPPLPSANSSALEQISSINTPISPRTLASPCGSTDYVFIPPSPSISSLYEVTMSDTLSPHHHAALLASARSAGMAKSVSSPGSIPSAHSLFSPPPVLYHQRYFESRRITSAPRVKKSYDRFSSSTTSITNTGAGSS
ncbi:hypothetical protein LPJ53_003642 [Coemansia erecta]|uniref:Uncharacterized protein n=1 Tax=Coemansia erecta TaxID=147472 RepID=A0A9W7Y0W6_9FUNG|nr:hypothetical protein LPJ53_003642 [Coemansia erecta]